MYYDLNGIYWTCVYGKQTVTRTFNIYLYTQFPKINFKISLFIDKFSVDMELNLTLIVINLYDTYMSISIIK